MIFISQVDPRPHRRLPAILLHPVHPVGPSQDAVDLHEVSFRHLPPHPYHPQHLVVQQDPEGSHQASVQAQEGEEGMSVDRLQICN